MRNLKDEASTTCLSSILRRLILFTVSLPTDPPSDTDTDTDNPENHQPSSPTRSTIPAGIVARLMGLDSFPNSHHTTAMRRSRSLGSVDFLPNFDQIAKQPHHLRAGTSVSFREVPTFLQSSHSQSEENGVSCVQKMNSGVMNAAKKEARDDGLLEEQKMKRKCKSSKRTYSHPLPKMGNHERIKAKEKEMLKRRPESKYSEESSVKILMEVCRLTVDEISSGSVCLVNTVQDMSYQIGEGILQMLVYEMIDELCRFP